MYLFKTVTPAISYRLFSGGILSLSAQTYNDLAEV